MVDFAQMQTLILTADLKNLGAVARKLKVSSAAISKQLTKLEQEIGLQLLIRSTRSIELTEIGDAYCQQCRRVLEEAESAAALISQINATPSGSLKICSGRHFAETYIVPHLKEFLQEYPKIKLHLELAERIPDINMEGIDVLVGMSLSATGDVIQKRIATTSYALCASPDYLKQHGTPKKPSDLIHHQYLTHSMRNPDDTLEFSTKDIVKLVPYLRVNDVQTLLQLALNGLGIVKLHRYVVQSHLNSGLLTEIMQNYHRTEVPIYIAYPQRRYISSPVRRFVDFITSTLSIEGSNSPT